ncbi:MAG TPA: hypothetical protein VHO03_12355 [Ignavibacteriales bacterium]|nr:hypothetical protein [Ignavibacteriales bacterium]
MMIPDSISHQTASDLEEVKTQYCEALKEREELLSVKSKVHYAIEHYKEQREAIKASMRKKTTGVIEITIYDFNYSGNPAIPDIFRKPSDNYQEQISTYQIKESSYSGLLPHLNGINREIMEKRLLFKEISRIIESIDLQLEVLERKAIELNTPNIVYKEAGSVLAEINTAPEDIKAEPLMSFSNEPAQISEVTEQLAEHGKKFRGRSLSKDTVKAYRNIFQENDRFIELYGKNDYRRFSFKAAYRDMGYIHEKEQKDFYKRFMQFKRRHKLKNTEDFMRFLKKVSTLR